MPALSEIVVKSFENHVGPFVFTTVDVNGTPNAIYASSVSIYDTETIIVADNYFDKTRQNIFNGSKGSILFITENKKSFQIKGSLEYHKAGEIYDIMKSRNPERLPGHAAVALKVEEIYSGAEKL